jgi:drug/metabolite transporter (DMT)-like permease
MPSTPQQRRRSILLVILFTALSAPAQYLIKIGANRIGPHPALMDLLTSSTLLGGLAMYGVGAMLMVLALKHGELSVLYPMISLSYVWVAIIAALALHEEMNAAKMAGIIVIMMGVTVLGTQRRA